MFLFCNFASSSIYVLILFCFSTHFSIWGSQKTTPHTLLGDDDDDDNWLRYDCYFSRKISPANRPTCVYICWVEDDAMGSLGHFMCDRERWWGSPEVRIYFFHFKGLIWSSFSLFLIDDWIDRQLKNEMKWECPPSRPRSVGAAIIKNLTKLLHRQL